MNDADRRRLNHRIRALAHGQCALTEAQYRLIVHAITDRDHITDCTDEQAGLVLAQLQMLATQKRVARREVNWRQQHLIARLMGYLNWSWDNTAHFVGREVGKNDTRDCTASELATVVRGMVAIIDRDIDLGTLVLSPEQLRDYFRHTRHHRKEEIHAA